MLKVRPPYWRQGLILHMAAAKAVAAAWGFLDTSFPSFVFAGWILLPSWQLLGNTIVCLPSLDPQGNASSPDCWGQGTCPLLPLLWTPSTLPEVLSPSLISTHCWALLLPKGLWDVGCSFCQLSPILAERHKGSRQIKYLSVAEAHNTSCL